LIYCQRRVRKVEKSLDGGGFCTFGQQTETKEKVGVKLSCYLAMDGKMISRRERKLKRWVRKRGEKR
jgi:hypothetical protein